MKIIKKAEKSVVKISHKEWLEIGKDANWTKEANAFMQQLNPQVKKALTDALKNSGLTLTKVIPFLETLFANLGDIPISQVKNVIEGLENQGQEIQNQNIQGQEIQNIQQ